MRGPGGLMSRKGGTSSVALSPDSSHARSPAMPLAARLLLAEGASENLAKNVTFEALLPRTATTAVWGVGLSPPAGCLPLTKRAG